MNLVRWFGVVAVMSGLGVAAPLSAGCRTRHRRRHSSTPCIRWRGSPLPRPCKTCRAGKRCLPRRPTIDLAERLAAAGDPGALRAAESKNTRVRHNRGQRRRRGGGGGNFPGSWRQDPGAGLPGDSGWHVRDDAAAGPDHALGIEAVSRFGVIPDFYADDITLDAAKVPVARADLPSDNMDEGGYEGATSVNTGCPPCAGPEISKIGSPWA